MLAAVALAVAVAQAPRAVQAVGVAQAPRAALAVGVAQAPRAALAVGVAQAPRAVQAAEGPWADGGVGAAPAAAVAPARRVALTPLDARGCGQVLVDGAAVVGAAPGLCVTQAVWTDLEGGLVALLVRAPHRFDAQVRGRVFVYRVDGRRLLPRFLGSGFREEDVVRLAPAGDALELEGAWGGRWRCRFDGFPLACLRAR